MSLTRVNTEGLIWALYHILVVAIADDCAVDKWLFHAARDRYVFFIKTSRPFMDSRGRCESLGGLLITVKDEDTNVFLNSHAKSLHWIGLFEETGGVGGERNFHWVDQTVLTDNEFVNWKRDEPSPAKHGDHLRCVVSDLTHGGVWSAQSCDTPNKAICLAVAPCYSRPTIRVHKDSQTYFSNDTLFFYEAHMGKMLHLYCQASGYTAGVESVSLECLGVKHAEDLVMTTLTLGEGLDGQRCTCQTHLKAGGRDSVWVEFAMISSEVGLDDSNATEDKQKVVRRNTESKLKEFVPPVAIVFLCLCFASLLVYLKGGSNTTDDHEDTSSHTVTEEELPLPMLKGRFQSSFEGAFEAVCGQGRVLSAQIAV